MYKNQTQNVDIRKSMFSFHSQEVEIFIMTFDKFLVYSLFYVANARKLMIYCIKYLTFSAGG